jgi:hypothetical protein
VVPHILCKRPGVENPHLFEFTGFKIWENTGHVVPHTGHAERPIFHLIFTGFSWIKSPDI